MNYHSNKQYLKSFYNSKVERPARDFVIIGIILVVFNVLAMLK